MYLYTKAVDELAPNWCALAFFAALSRRYLAGVSEGSILDRLLLCRFVAAFQPLLELFYRFAAALQPFLALVQPLFSRFFATFWQLLSF
eukprot:4234741-Pleurochrysis_carterae.AAC.1